jgi:hypothetical protein
MNIPTKLCSRGQNCCHPHGPELPATHEYFKRDKQNKVGFASQCRACSREGKNRHDHKHNYDEWLEERRIVKLMAERGLKKCICGEECKTEGGPWLPATRDYFNACNKVKSGLAANCKKCQTFQRNERKNQDIEKYKLAVKEYGRSYRQKNPDKIRARNQNYYLKHPDIVKRAQKNYRENNRNALTVHHSRRRALKRTLDNDLTTSDWQMALDYFENRCAVCGRSPDFWTVIVPDHWQPLSKGGGTSANNIIPLCHARPGVPQGEPCCNNSKGNKEPEIWLMERFGSTKAKQVLKSVQTYFNSCAKK